MHIGDVELMFDTEQLGNTIEDAVEQYWVKAKEEIEAELTSRGYEHIFEEINVSYSKDGISINATFKEDIKTEDQDVFELLARGGELQKEDGSFIEVKPSSTLIKYLSKR